MNELHLLLSLTVGLLSTISLIAYLRLRRENKRAFRELRASPPVRKLSAEERETLQPHLTRSVKPLRRYQLLSDDVYRLQGPYVQHGIRTRGATTMHQTLGGVDVILPANARDVLDAMNEAEVVLAKDRAIVVSLNGRFRILEARGDQVKPEETASTRAPTCAAVRNPGTRDETDAELAARTRGRVGWLPASVLTAATGLFFLACTDFGQALPLWPSLALAGLGIGLQWTRRGLARKQRIDEAEGSLILVKVQSPNNPVLAIPQFFVGSDLPVRLPARWSALAHALVGRQVRVALRADGSLVRFADKLSIDEEERRFPKVGWAAPLLGTVLAGALGVTGWLGNHQLALDVLHAIAPLRAHAPVLLDDAGRVRAQPPSVGTLVHAVGRARCQIGPSPLGEPGPIRCHELRWGGQALHVPAVQPDAAALRIADGELLKARDASVAALLLDVLARRADDSEPAIPTAQPRVFLIDNMSELVVAVDGACHGSRTEDVCARLEQALSAEVQVDLGDEPLEWPALVKVAKDRLLAEAGDTGMVRAGTLSSLRQDLRRLAQLRLFESYAAPMAEVLASQRGGVVLRVQAGLFFAPIDRPIDSPIDEPTTDWTQSWAAYQALAQPTGERAFDVEGMVVRSEEEGRDWVVTIDSLCRADNSRSALLHILPVMVGGPLFVLQLGLLIRARRRITRRRQALAAYHEQILVESRG